MIIESIQKVKLYELLFLIDQDLAEKKKSEDCPFCSANLHTSNYPRKPRGGPDTLPDELFIRHSLCCSSESCRKRVLPASCRFWGRKVYWGVIILVIMALQQGQTESYSAGRLKQLFGISRHTLKRWMVYFRQHFPVTKRWKRIKGVIGFEISGECLPGSLVNYLIERTQSIEKGLIQSLQLFLGGLEVI